MAACSLDTAVRNSIAAGASLEKLALLDNFCWCSSHEPERLGQLKRAAQACHDTAIIYQTPFISGKDSMFNDFKGFDEKGKPLKISILPTLLISSIGIIDNVKKVVSMDFKFPGDLVYILGETFEELGGSEYYRFLGEQKGKEYIGNHVPKVNAPKNKRLYRALSKCIKEELVAASQSIGRGGLALALTKMAMAGKLGAKISLKSLPGKFSRSDFALFSETQGRIIVTINPKNKNKFEQIMDNNIFAKLGKVTNKKIIIIENKKGKVVVNLNLDSALESYRSTFKNF